MNRIYVDRLSFSSLLAIIFSEVKYAHIFYFSISAKANFIINIFIRIRLLKHKPQLVKFQLLDIRDKNGESQFFRIWDDIMAICFEISEKEFVNNTFLKELSEYFDFKKILLFFEKTIAAEINATVIFINATKWHAENKIDIAREPIVFFHQKNCWSKYLSLYAARLKIRLVEYKSAIDPFYFNYFAIGKYLVLTEIKARFKTTKTDKDKNIYTQEKGLLQIIDKNTPLVSTWYTGRTVTFELKKRSDFFWFLKSDIPAKQILIYFGKKDIPATEEARNILNNTGFKFIALSNGAKTTDNIPLWNPSNAHKRMKRYFIKLISRKFLLKIIRLKVPSLFFITNLFYFIEQYAYWHDFFKSNGVKININPEDFSTLNIPMHLALEENGGISISYQWSNLHFYSILSSSCADVLFSFGPAYRQTWKRNKSQIGNLVYSGYITDYSFKEVKEDSLKLREQLRSRGVKFIICYFDENSSDEMMSLISNRSSAEIYRYFIEHMLKDETLGLIFKPGYPKTLFRRILSIADLIEKAKASQRCIFMDKGTYITERYPTEAAQASDLCVGLLLSGTSALESYLSGIPTIFLDLEKLYSNPIYQWGKGKVVFDDINELFVAIERFRKSPESTVGFGDLSLWAKDKDCFKDGNAALRIGQYINWLLEMLKQERTRQEAIEYANQRYTAYWGKDRIVKWH